MESYDQHMHSNFSPDCQEPLENYLPVAQGPLVTTEHLDFRVPNQGFGNIILDYPRYTQTIAALSQKTGQRFLKGLEVGFTTEAYPDILAYLKAKSFDVILLSVHQNGTYDFMEPRVGKMDPTKILTEYLQLSEKAIQTATFANVFAHFDYGLRVFGGQINVTDLKTVEKQLTNILESLIEKQMALEMNTRSMYQYGNVKLYEYVLQLYKYLGGKLISLGSDAHSVPVYRYHFADAIALLKQHGFHAVMQYEKGKGYPAEI